MVNMRINVKRKKTVQEERGIALSMTRVLTSECSVHDIRKVVSGLKNSHPYLGYLDMKNFEDTELLTRQQEVVGALLSVVRTAFTAVKSNVLKVTSSNAGIPTVVQSMGFGRTWGEIAFATGIGIAIDRVVKLGKYDAEGVTDHAGLTERYSQIPPGTTMKLPAAVWKGKKPLDMYAPSDQVVYIAEFYTKLAAMSKTLVSVVDGKLDIETWLAPLKGSGGNNIWIVKPIHRQQGFIIYKNDDNMFVELVTTDEVYPKVGLIPEPTALMEIQKAVQKLDKAARSASKSIIAGVAEAVKRLGGNVESTTEALASDEQVAKTEGKAKPEKTAPTTTLKKVSSSTSGAFATKLLKVLYEDSVPLTEAAVTDIKDYMHTAIASILVYKPKEEDSPLSKEINSDNGKTDKETSEPTVKEKSQSTKATGGR